MIQITGATRYFCLDFALLHHLQLNHMLLGFFSHMTHKSPGVYWFLIEMPHIQRCLAKCGVCWLKGSLGCY